MKQNYDNEVFEIRNNRKGLPSVGISLEMQTLEVASEKSSSCEVTSGLSFTTQWEMKRERK